MDKMRKQAERWGAVMHSEDVVEVDFTSRPFTVSSSERTVKANSRRRGHRRHGAKTRNTRRKDAVESRHKRVRDLRWCEPDFQG